MGPSLKWISFSVAAVLVTSASAASYRTISAPIVPAAMRQQAVGFKLEDAAGKKVSLAEYRGKVVLLDFWATDCGGCVDEMPFFIDLARKSNSKDMAVVGVSVDVLYDSLKSTDEGWSRVKPFVKSRHVPYQILMADDAVTTAYNIQALPLTYLIDKQGKVAATYFGVVNEASVNANIKELLAERR